MYRFFKVLLLVLISGSALGQVTQVITSGSPKILTRQPNTQAYSLFIIPVYPDTTTALATSGIDSLGMVFQIRSNGNWYRRDTSAGTHKWTLFGSGGGSAAWGAIGGTLSSQTDLQSALNLKLNITDTAALVAVYLRTNVAAATYATISVVNGKVNISDTSAMLNNYFQKIMAPNSIKGNNTGSAIAGIDLTGAQVTAMLGIATTSLQGLAPAAPHNGMKLGMVGGVATWQDTTLPGAGNTNSNIGSGYRIAVPTTNNLKTLFCVGCTIDSVSNTNGLTITVSGGTSALTNSHIFVGNGSNVAADVAMSGDATMANTGAITVGANKIDNTKAAQAPANTIKSNLTGSTANEGDNTVANVAAAISPLLPTQPVNAARGLSATVVGGNNTVVLGSAAGSAPLDSAVYIDGSNAQKIELDSMKALSGHGFRVNFTSDAGWDMFTRDSATNFWTRIPKGTVGQSLQMVGSGGIGWAAQAGGGGGGSQTLQQTLALGNTATTNLIDSNNVQMDSALARNANLIGNVRIGDTILASPPTWNIYGSSGSTQPGVSASTGYGAVTTTYLRQVVVKDSALSGTGISRNQGASALWFRIAGLPVYNSATSFLWSVDAGINDAIVDSVQYKADLNSIIDTLHLARGWPLSKILIMSPWYCPTRLSDSFFVALDQRQCAAKGVLFLDIYHPFLIGYLQQGLPLIAFDSLHPSTMGQFFWAGLISNAVKFGHFIGNLTTYGNDTTRQNKVNIQNEYTSGTTFPLGGFSQIPINTFTNWTIPRAVSFGQWGGLNFRNDPSTTDTGSNWALRYIAQATRSNFDIVANKAGVEDTVIHMIGTSAGVFDKLVFNGSTPQTGYQYTMNGGALYVNGAANIQGSIIIKGDNTNAINRYPLFSNGGNQFGFGSDGSNNTYISNSFGQIQFGGISGGAFTGHSAFDANATRLMIGTLTDDGSTPLQVNGIAKVTALTIVGDNVYRPQYLPLFSGSGNYIGVGITSGNEVEHSNGFGPISFGRTSGGTWTGYSQFLPTSTGLGSLKLGLYDAAGSDSNAWLQTGANTAGRANFYTKPSGVAYAGSANGHWWADSLHNFVGLYWNGAPFNFLAPTYATNSAHDSTTKAANDLYVDRAVAQGIAAIPNSKIFAATADASVNNTTTPTSMVGTGVGSNTIAANPLVAGSTITFTGSGTITSALTAPTLTMNFKAGTSGNTITPTVGVSLNGNIEWSVTVIVRTTGSGGTGSWTGWFSINGTKTYFGTGSPFALNTTTTNTIDMIATLGGTVGTGDIITTTNSNIFLN